MEQNNTYTYSYQPRQRSPSAASSRSGGAYQNSSAFSASANPDEDWTKISDLAERRRIQNRIAQRNYRKKLKRRLEDLERRTTSSSASPEQSHRELVKPAANELNIPSNQQMQRRLSAPRAGTVPQNQPYSNDLLSSGDAWMNSNTNNKPAYSSYSTPSTYTFPDSYPPTAEYFPDDLNSTAYNRMPMMYANPSFPPEYIQSISPPLPSMIPSENYKAEPQYSNGELLTPFNMSYASLAGFNVPTQQGSSDMARRRAPHR